MASKYVRTVTFTLSALLAAALPTATPAAAREPKPPHRMNLPKPTPAGGDTRPFVVTGSSADPGAATIGVIGDSVARDYAYYLAKVLGPRGIRVVDGALSGCPAGTLQLISRIHNVAKLLRAGDCPSLVTAKQSELTHNGFAPKVIVWHSITEIWDIQGENGAITSGSEEWRRRVMADWDITLARLTRGGARVVVILPLWYEHIPPARLDAPGPSVEKVRDLYTRWAARHRDKVRLVDVAPVACPTGPPCGTVNGIDFRPDTTHFDDDGGMLVAADLASRVPELAALRH